MPNTKKTTTKKAKTSTTKEKTSNDLWSMIKDTCNGLLSVISVIFAFLVELLLGIAKILKAFGLVLVSLTGAVALLALAFYLVSLAFNVQESNMWNLYRERVIRSVIHHYEEEKEIKPVEVHEVSEENGAE